MKKALIHVKYDKKTEPRQSKAPIVAIGALGGTALQQGHKKHKKQHKPHATTQHKGRYRPTVSHTPRIDLH